MQEQKKIYVLTVTGTSKYINSTKENNGTWETQTRFYETKAKKIYCIDDKKEVIDCAKKLNHYDPEFTAKEHELVILEDEESTRKEKKKHYEVRVEVPHKDEDDNSRTAEFYYVFGTLREVDTYAIQHKRKTKAGKNLVFINEIQIADHSVIEPFVKEMTELYAKMTKLNNDFRATNQTEVVVEHHADYSHDCVRCGVPYDFKYGHNRCRTGDFD